MSSEWALRWDSSDRPRLNFGTDRKWSANGKAQGDARPRAMGGTPLEPWKVVGATGFEPATPCAQGRCATRLRYAPTSSGPSIVEHFQHPAFSAARYHPREETRRD